MRKKIARKCIVCGKNFIGERKTCSDSCLRKSRESAQMARWDKQGRIQKFCAICGKPVPIIRAQCPEQSCGNPECRSALKSKVMKNHPELVPTMIRERSKMAKFQPIPENMSAKEWFLISPSGKKYQVRNLKHFIRTHLDLFTEAELKQGMPHMRRGKMIEGDLLAYRQISALRPTRATSKAHPKRPESWHGWMWSNE